MGVDVEANVRIVTRARKRATPCCVAFFIFSMIAASALTVLVFIMTREDSKNLVDPNQRLASLKIQLTEELHEIKINIQKITEGKTPCVKVCRSRWLRWSNLLTVVIGFVTGGYLGSGPACTGELSETQKFA